MRAQPGVASIRLHMHVHVHVNDMYNVHVQAHVHVVFKLLYLTCTYLQIMQLFSYMLL